jgi:hypothetical protein
MWPASYIRGMSRIVLRLIPAVVIASCRNPVDPEFRDLPILGYTISAQANGTDPATGEGLTCLFIIQNLLTGGPLIGTWTDTTTIKVIRIRTSPTLQVTHDTTMVGEEVTLTVPDSAHIQLTIAGPLTENLTAELDPHYLGWAQGDWTCGPEHPLARVQPGVVLTGKWQTQPIIDYPID